MTRPVEIPRRLDNGDFLAGAAADEQQPKSFGSAAPLATLLRLYVQAYPAFRSKPIGAPGSAARATQEMQIALEDAAKALLDSDCVTGPELLTRAYLAQQA